MKDAMSINNNQLCARYHGRICGLCLCAFMFAIILPLCFHILFNGQFIMDFEVLEKIPPTKYAYAYYQ